MHIELYLYFLRKFILSFERSMVKCLICLSLKLHVYVAEQTSVQPLQFDVIVTAPVVIVSYCCLQFGKPGRGEYARDLVKYQVRSFCCLL